MDRHASLPPQPTTLIGRDAEIAMACALLRDPAVRLLTLTGPAGVGKTRLAIEIAGRMPDAAAAGVVFVDLAPLEDAALVLPAIGRALGLRENPNRDIAEQVAAAVAEQRLLLLLDNVEHVLSAAPSLSDLLAACPALTLLDTSRAPLRLRWERELPVPPLAVPDVAQASAGPPLASVPSVALFVERARAVRPSFDLTDETAPAVAAICARLDGLPLAIELVAARVRSFSPIALAAALADDGASPLDLVAGGARDLPARQRTLRDALAWSHDLLSPTDQRTFRQIAVFPAGFTADGVAAICGGGPRDTLARLAALAESNLLVPQTATAEPRFVMLAMVREYARERLAGAGEEAEAHRRLVAHLLTLAEEAEPHLRSGGREPWLARLDTALDTTRAALAWCERDPDSLEAGLRLATALEWFWHFRDHWREAYERVEALLARSETTRVPDPVLAVALRVAGRFAVFLGRFAEASARLDRAATLADAARQPLIRALALIFLVRRGWFAGEPPAVHLPFAEESVTILRSMGDRWWLAIALFYLADTHRRMGNVPAAHAAIDESVALFQEFDDGWGASLGGNVLSLALMQEGNWQAARRVEEGNLARLRASREKLAVAVSTQAMGNLARLSGDLAAAGAAHTEALALHREVGHLTGAAMSLRGLGHVSLALGDQARAAVAFREGLAITRTHPDILNIAWFLIGLAELGIARLHADRAIRLLGAAEGLVEAAGLKLGPLTRADFERVCATVRSMPDAVAIDGAWSAGRLLSREEAVAEALDLAAQCLHEPEKAAAGGVQPRRGKHGGGHAGLTRREAEILTLLAQGQSNREIAAALVVSVRTVEHHIARLYAKIGARRRADATAYAVHHGLASADIAAM